MSSRRTAKRATPLVVGITTLEVGARASWPKEAVLEDFGEQGGLIEKQNSGDAREWGLVTKENGLIFLSDPDMARKYEDRSEILDKLPMGMAPAFVLREFDASDGSKLVSAKSVLFATNDIITVKMWGFSGMNKYADPMFIYTNAVYALLNGDVALGVKGLHELLRDRVQSGTIEPPSILLTFDGDPACERKGDKMSHCIFAPMVAELIHKALNLPVHLMILKIDKDSVGDILKKFVDKDPIDGSYSMRVLPAASGDPKHFYPNFTTAFFESCTIIAQKVASTADSEVQTSEMLTALLGERIKHRCCLCVGSNSQKSVLAMSEKGAAQFDLAVRIHLYGLFMPPPPKK